jgi:16S rRNA (uracil1498-N3)-methyltransferase
VSAETPSLRSLQKDHSLILLSATEFSRFIQNRSLPLPERHREHFGKVLRRKDLWPALIGDGAGALRRANIADGNIVAETGDIPLEINTQRRQVKLVQAWVKPKALAVILQKAAEIGADEITLVDTEYAQPHSEKAQRLDAILENACMQAYNPKKPVLAFAESLAQIALNKTAAFFGDLGARLSLRNQAVNATSAAFINGPEGGFSAAEIALLRERATGVLLSENVLRSDSAAIIALGLLRLPE